MSDDEHGPAGDLDRLYSESCSCRSEPGIIASRRRFDENRERASIRRPERRSPGRRADTRRKEAGFAYPSARTAYILPAARADS